MKNRFGVVALVALALALVVCESSGQTLCGSVDEYCQVGCEELGYVGAAASYRAEPFDSLGAAVDRLLELDPIERITYAILQPSSGSAFVLVYRAKFDRAPQSGPWKVELRYTAALAATLRGSYSNFSHSAGSCELNSGMFVVVSRPKCP